MGDTGWIGVDLDGTLAEYHGWLGEEHIGAPIPAMVERVKRWLADGVEVRIVTARVCDFRDSEDRAAVRHAIKRWCEEHIGQALAVTAQKDYGMVQLWDDRCVQVETNTGRRIGEDDG